MRPRVLTIPFAVACVAMVVRVAIGLNWWLWVWKGLREQSTLEFPVFAASYWVGYGMLVLSVILERRHFGLRSRPARLWAYRLTLIANAFFPIIYTEEFVRAFGFPLARPQALRIVLVSLSYAGFAFGCISWAIVGFLSLFRDRTSDVPGRPLPAGFAFLGSMEHWFAGFVFLITSR